MEDVLDVIRCAFAGIAPDDVLAEVSPVELLRHRVGKAIHGDEPGAGSGFLETEIVVRRKELHPGPPGGTPRHSAEEVFVVTEVGGFSRETATLDDALFQALHKRANRGVLVES